MDNGDMSSSYRRFLDGDESAFDNIIKEYRDNLTFFINRFVHDMSAAEDIAIDAFMELIVHKHRFNFKTSLKTYLFMIGKSRALDYIKHRNKLEMVELSEVADTLSDDCMVEASVLNDEMKRQVNEAIAKLPEDMQAVVHLVYFEELSYKEAAKVMKKTAKQIDNLLFRTKDKLRTILGREGGLL